MKAFIIYDLIHDGHVTFSCIEALNCIQPHNQMCLWRVVCAKETNMVLGNQQIGTTFDFYLGWQVINAVIKYMHQIADQNSDILDSFPCWRRWMHHRNDDTRFSARS